MILRSLLFVPGDSERKLARASDAGADALILDLEDGVAATRRDVARGLVHDRLAARAPGGAALMVRVNPIATAEALRDLTAVMPGRPDGIVLPKAASPDDARRLAHYLDVLEAQHDIAAGSTRILPVATELPEALFALGGYAGVGPRLAALTWGAEDLAAAVGAPANVDETGTWSPPFQLARSLCLFAAAAAKVPAIDTLHANYRDDAGLIASARRARRDGFAGKIAIHPGQVAAINEAFAPPSDEVARAERIVALFASQGDAGAVGLDGVMLDASHLAHARRTLAVAAAGRVPR